MFERVTIRASDRAESERFYGIVLRTLGLEPGRWGDFSVAQADGGHPVTRRLHIGFTAASRADVDAFWRAGTEAGFEDDGEPGPRPQYTDDYYGGFLLDPDGNSAEAVHHGGVRKDGSVDHLWIRVADVKASKAFYETIAPHAGLRLGSDTPERAQFLGRGGSFSLVAGTPTENVHMAFPAEDGGAFADPDGNTVELVKLS